MTQENQAETKRDEYPNLPYSLVLFCQMECQPMIFGRRQGAIYECPCGEFHWDIKSEDPKRAGKVVRDGSPVHEEEGTRPQPPGQDESRQESKHNHHEEQERALRNIMRTISALTPSASIRRTVLAQIQEIQMSSFSQGMNESQKAHCPIEGTELSPGDPCPNTNKVSRYAHQCPECPHRKG